MPDNRLVMDDSESNSYKIVVVGSSGVGKTAIVNQLVNKTFKEEGQPTIGVEFKSFAINAEGELVKLQIWDTAGQERFRSVSKAYFRNAIGALLVFDLTQKPTFDEVNTWLNDLTTLCAANAYIVLVGNKSDLKDDRAVSAGEADEAARRYNLEYIETSAKDGSGVAEAFARLAGGIVRKNKQNPAPTQAPSVKKDVIKISPTAAVPDDACC
jgi:small GTP-binding protein